MDARKIFNKRKDNVLVADIPAAGSPEAAGNLEADSPGAGGSPAAGCSSRCSTCFLEGIYSARREPRVSRSSSFFSFWFLQTGWRDVMAYLKRRYGVPSAYATAIGMAYTEAQPW